MITNIPNDKKTVKAKFKPITNIIWKWKWITINATICVQCPRPSPCSHLRIRYNNILNVSGINWWTWNCCKCDVGFFCNLKEQFKNKFMGQCTKTILACLDYGLCIILVHTHTCMEKQILKRSTLSFNLSWRIEMSFIVCSNWKFVVSRNLGCKRFVAKYKLFEWNNLKCN